MDPNVVETAVTEAEENLARLLATICLNLKGDSNRQIRRDVIRESQSRVYNKVLLILNQSTKDNNSNGTTVV